MSESVPPEALPTFQEISAAAQELAAAAAELAKSIRAIEEFLDMKALGVSAWTRVKGWEEQDGTFWKREVGYNLFRDGWHLAIREAKGNANFPEDIDEHVWSFNQAPRKSRISAAEKVPELLRHLIKESERTSKRLREKSVDLAAFANSLKPKLPVKASNGQKG